jgi:hypothetical protein
MNYFQQEFNEEIMNSVEITLKAAHERFCQEYASGATATDAYMKAFPKNKSNRKTISEAASRFIKRNPIILKRIWQIRSNIKGKRIMNLEEAMERLSIIARSSEYAKLEALKKIIDFYTFEKKAANISISRASSDKDDLNKSQKIGGEGSSGVIGIKIEI